MLGYCFGGDLTLLMAARHPELPIRSLTTIATPVDFTKMGLMTEAVQPGNLEVDELVDDTGNIPPNVIRQAFRVLKPTADLSQVRQPAAEPGQRQLPGRAPDDDAVDRGPHPLPGRGGAADGRPAGATQRSV